MGSILERYKQDHLPKERSIEGWLLKTYPLDPMIRADSVIIECIHSGTQAKIELIIIAGVVQLYLDLSKVDGAKQYLFNPAHLLPIDGYRISDTVILPDPVSLQYSGLIRYHLGDNLAIYKANASEKSIKRIKNSPKLESNSQKVAISVLNDPESCIFELARTEFPESPNDEMNGAMLICLKLDEGYNHVAISRGKPGMSPSSEIHTSVEAVASVIGLPLKLREMLETTITKSQEKFTAKLSNIDRFEDETRMTYLSSLCEISSRDPISSTYFLLLGKIYSSRNYRIAEEINALFNLSLLSQPERSVHEDNTAIERITPKKITKFIEEPEMTMQYTGRYGLRDKPEVKLHHRMNVPMEQAARYIERYLEVIKRSLIIESNEYSEGYSVIVYDQETPGPLPGKTHLIEAKDRGQNRFVIIKMRDELIFIYQIYGISQSNKIALSEIHRSFERWSGRGDPKNIAWSSTSDFTTPASQQWFDVHFQMSCCSNAEQSVFLQEYIKKIDGLLPMPELFQRKANELIGQGLSNDEPIKRIKLDQ